MAFCANCGNQISDQAVACPNCGHPGPAATKATAARGQLASWGQRVGAALLDGLVLMVPIIIFMSWLVTTSDVDWASVFEPDFDPDNLTGEQMRVFAVFAIGLLAVSIVTMLYKPLFEGTKGQTLGKMWVKIKVVRADDGGPIGMGKAYFRWFIYMMINFVSPLNLVNFLWPLWDDNNQTLHDKAAKTVVVRVTNPAS